VWCFILIAKEIWKMFPSQPCNIVWDKIRANKQSDSYIPLRKLCDTVKLFLLIDFFILRILWVGQSTNWRSQKDIYSILLYCSYSWTSTNSSVYEHSHRCQTILFSAHEIPPIHFWTQRSSLSKKVIGRTRFCCKVMLWPWPSR